MKGKWLWVDAKQKLSKVRDDIEGSPVIAIDTEYDSFRYFREKLCLGPVLSRRGLRQPDPGQGHPRRRQRHPDPEPRLRIRVRQRLRHPPGRLPAGLQPPLPLLRHRAVPGPAPGETEENAALALGETPPDGGTAQLRSGGHPAPHPAVPQAQRGDRGQGAPVAGGAGLRGHRRSALGREEVQPPRLPGNPGLRLAPGREEAEAARPVPRARRSGGCATCTAGGSERPRRRTRRAS